jgi:hypothetical protein
VGRSHSTPMTTTLRCISLIVKSCLSSTFSPSSDPSRNRHSPSTPKKFIV